MSSSAESMESSNRQARADSGENGAGAWIGGPGDLPSTRAEAVLTTLRQLILSGEIPPKTKLRQVDVSRRFGVSTTPVREAFQTLAREGLVNQDAHRGVEVILPSQGELLENYEIRIALEPLAAKLAAGKLSAEDLDELADIEQRMQQAPDPAKRSAMNRAFHDKIYAAAGRPQLHEVIRQFRNSAQVFLNLLSSHTTSEYKAAVVDEHQAILESLRAEDGERSAAAMERHLTHSLAAISGMLDQLEHDQA